MEARDVRHLVTPESSSAAHRVISRIDTIPTTLPPSTIGRWRMFFDTICSAASDSSVFEPTVIEIATGHAVLDGRRVRIAAGRDEVHDVPLGDDAGELFPIEHDDR